MRTSTLVVKVPCFVTLRRELRTGRYVKLRRDGEIDGSTASCDPPRLCMACLLQHIWILGIPSRRNKCDETSDKMSSRSALCSCLRQQNPTLIAKKSARQCTVRLQPACRRYEPFVKANHAIDSWPILRYIWRAHTGYGCYHRPVLRARLECGAMPVWRSRARRPVLVRLQYFCTRMLP